ncbi:MAG: recombinase family protein, partial [Deltaproteobacteria bacterium]|nr:recombinase family protein [Deltaproteobacteria bacterium]
VSTRHQAEEGFSLDDQRTTLTNLATSRGWTHTVYEDAGISGETLDDRPGMLALLAAVDRGEHHAVLVADESRLARDDLTAAIIRDRFQRSKLTLVTPTGDRDLADPSGSFTATVLAAAASLEQKIRTAKTAAGLRNTARAGFWPGGPAPYGYALTEDPDGSRHTVLSINDGEAVILREAAEMILDHGHSTWTAARTLNATGKLTRGGTPWYFRNLAFQLTKPHLAGTYTYQSAEGPISMEIPAILDQGRWDALQALLRAPQTPQRQNKFYALTGFLKCACGGSLSGVYRKDGDTRFYKCSRSASTHEPGAIRCPHYPRQIDADQLETSIWGEIRSLLTSPDRLRQAAQAHIDTSLADAPIRTTQRATISHRLDQLDLEETGVIRTHARQQITDAQLAETLEQISDERVTLHGHLAQLDAWDTQRRTNRAHLSQLEHLAQQATTSLATTTPEDQRRVYELLDLHIDVTPQRTYEISGTIPTHGPLTGETLSEVSTGALRDP